MSESKSINWINALKALCILLVFLRHSENYYGEDLGWFDCLFLPFYVNAFFFVSGYLLFWKQLSFPGINETRKEYLCGGGKKLLFNIFFRIVIPSILFSSIEFFPKKIVKGDGVFLSDFLVETVGGCTYWFTSALVISELILLLMFLTRIRSLWYYTLVAFAISVLGGWLFVIDFSFMKDYNSFPWQFKHGLICMCYMALGSIYWRYESLIHRLLNGWFLFWLVTIYVIGSLLFHPLFYSGYMTSMGYINIVGVLWSFFASILLTETCKRLPPIKFITFIGQNSIGFYFMSGALPIILGIVAHKMVYGIHIWLIPFIWIIGVIIAYVVVEIINRNLPWLFDIRKLR